MHLEKLFLKSSKLTELQADKTGKIVEKNCAEKFYFDNFINMLV